MSKSDLEKRQFKTHDVILIPSKDGSARPALITRVGGDGTTHDTTTVNYSFIDSSGNLSGGHYFRGEYEMKDVKKIDFAKVRTVVDLPPDYEKLAFDYEQKTGAAQKERAELLGEWDPETHPSYGAVQVGRISGHASLFMSPFRHQHFMKLTIGRSSKNRSHGRDWNFGSTRGELVEILLSEAQWAHMVSSAGLGSGTPCTISYVGGHRMDECPEQMEIERFHTDIENSTTQAMKFMEEAMKAAEELIADKAPSKAKREKVLSILSTAHRKLSDTAPFIAKSLRERMDTIIMEGKTEIEAFAHNTLIEGGIAKLAESLGKDAKVITFNAGSAPKVIEADTKKDGGK